MSDARLHAPATERNRDVIAQHLRAILPPCGIVLEIASGSGEHAVYLASCFPNLVFQPTDREPAALASIDAWAAHAGRHNVRRSLFLDAACDTWPVAHADAVLCINMIHISPWEATIGLLRGAARVLPPGAPLVLYGPFRRAGVPLEPSNLDFDLDLRARDARFGLRLLEDLTGLATDFLAPGVSAVAANNLIVVYIRK